MRKGHVEQERFHVQVRSQGCIPYSPHTSFPLEISSVPLARQDGASKLILASWRHNTESVYSANWGRWACWYGYNPLCAPIDFFDA